MKGSGFSTVMTCVGAVLGAGFASGREITAFFTRYGLHSWWLIGLCSGVMAALFALCLQGTQHSSPACCQLGILEKKTCLAKLCVLVLLIVISGAMTAASGQMIALLWANEWAYSIGVVGTLFLAWRWSFRRTEWFAALGTLLALLFTAAVGVCFFTLPASKAVSIGKEGGSFALCKAAVRLIGYAAMNMTLAIGVICKAGSRGKCRNLSIAFGWMMAGLMGISNALYLRHPQLIDEAFPMVKLLSHFGRYGFLASVLLMYFSILTTLVALLCMLRSAVEPYVLHPALRFILTMGCPLAVSCVGFAGVVDALYAPAGWLCLIAVFLPIVKNSFKTSACKEKLDNPSSIQ